MDEIEDLIRLLVEAPAEEPPLTRPRELLERIAIEKAVTGDQPPKEAAVPPAEPTPPRQSLGAVANPKTAMPDVPFMAVPTDIMPSSVPPVAPRVQPAVYGRESVVMTPEMFTARSVTPRLLESMAAMPATANVPTPRSVAMVSPKARVEVVVPAAYPIDPSKLFAAADNLKPPPPPEPVQFKSPFGGIDSDGIETSEQLAVRSWQETRGIDQTDQRSPL